LPTGHCRFDIDPDVFVGAADDLGGVDLRPRGRGSGWHGAGRADGGIRLRRSCRHVVRRLGDLRVGASHADDENREHNARSIPKGDNHVTTSEGKSIGRHP
jgi:hypothetical protein